VLQHVNISRARSLAVVINDPAATRRITELARRLNARAYIIVRTRFIQEMGPLKELGANEVIPEEFETSIEIFTRVLDKYHVPRNVIDAQVRVLRGECYGILRGTSEAVRPSMERIADLLAEGTADTFFVGGGRWPAGKTLKEIDLRKASGATVIAVVRGEESFPGPGAEFAIESGDTLVLVASHRNMDRAFRYLTDRDACAGVE